MHALVDWELSGAAPLARALADIDAARRADVAARGLAEIDASAGDLGPVRSALGSLVLRLHNGVLRAADEDERREALEAVRVPDSAAGLSESQRRRLNALRDRAAEVHDVLVADRHRPPALPLAVTPDGRRVILVRPG